MRRDETTTPPYSESGQYIRDLLLAGADDDIVERLALAAVAAIEQRRALADVLRAALDRLAAQDREIDALRRQVRRLRSAEAERRPEAA